MKILLFKKTTDSDLSEGQEVAYKDKVGEYSLIGTIRQTWIDSDGVTRLYSLVDVPGTYMADELKKQV